jgi:drug/metabolite transporter (DMT)-like permease
LLRAHLALLFVQVCFGLFPLVAKRAFDNFAPEAVASYRILAGGGVLLMLAFLSHGRKAWPPSYLMPRMVFCGSVGIALNQFCFLRGLKHSSSINAALILALIPVLTFLFATGFRYERLVARRLLGVLVAAAGIAYLIVEKGVDLSSEAFVGNLLFLGSATSYSLYLVVSRPLLKDLPPVVATAWIFVGSSWTVPFIMFGNSFVSLGVSDAWWTLPWIIIFPTVLTYLLNLYAMVRVPSSVIAFYVFLQPLITATAGVALLSEELTTGVWVAAPCVFLGMLLVMPRRKTLPPLVPMPSTVTAEAAPSSEG